DGEEENIGEPVDVYCIEPSDPSITKQEEEYYRETFTIMNDCGVGAVWLSEEKAMGVTSKNDSFYFVPAFRGRVFEHLKKLRDGEEENIGEPVDVYCIEPSDPSITKQEEEYYRETFTIMNDCGVGAVWLSEEKAMGVTSKNDSFYFVPAFRGRVFEHLKKLRVNLYGVHVVRQTLNNGGSLPRWDFPVYALNLTGACVCFTGLPLDKREELKAKINYMNGVVSPCLTEKVTHLVTEHCDTASKKYTEARRMSLPIMLPAWIEKAWEAAQNFSVDLFTSGDLAQQYRTPIFNKMVITATGVGGSERMDIARLIELHGGRFSGDMKRNECTHLIADHPKGMKYKKAREWNSIKIVRSTWLRKSVMAGYILPESAFDPEKRNRCSTPVQESRIVEPEELDFSMIQGRGGRLDHSTFNTQISKNDGDSEAERTPLSAVRTNLRREPSRHRLATSTPVVVDPLDQLDETCIRGDFDFLEGCRIWVCGAEQSRADKWKKVLDRSGATRVAGMEAASHIVVVHASTSDRSRLIQAKSRGAHIVRAEWITACYAKKDQVALEEFLWDPEEVICRTSSFCLREPMALQQQQKTWVRPTISTSLRSTTFLMILTYLQSFGKVVPSSDEQAYVNYLVCSHIEFDQVYPKDSYEEAVTVFWVKRCLMEHRLLKPSSHPLFRPFPAVRDSKVFSNIVAVISCFSDHERLTLAQLIKEFGGKVQETLTRRNRGDQLAVTHVIGGSEGDRVMEARRQKFKVVDPSWVIESIINDKLMKEDQFALKGEAYASYEGRTDDLWPEATRNSRLRSSGLGKSSVQEAPRDDFSDLITTSMVGRILKEVAVKTAAVKPQRSAPVAASSSIPPASVQDLDKPQQSTRQAKQKSVAKAVCSTKDEQDRMGDMMALRARMTERLEQRNREIANQLAENNPAPEGPLSGKPTQEVGSLRGRKRGQPSTEEAEPSSKRSSQLGTARSSEHETPRPLIEWQPAMPSKCGSTSGDTSNDSLTTSMVGRILKEVAVKTAAVKPQRSAPVAATNQLAENNSAPEGPLSGKPTQEVGSLRGRKRGQPSTEEAEPSSKRSSQVGTARSSEHETPRPLIEWQPAMPSKNLEKRVGTDFKQLLPYTRSYRSSAIRFQAISGWLHKYLLRLALIRSRPIPGEHKGETPEAHRAQAESRSAPLPPRGSVLPQGSGQSNSHTVSSKVRKSGGAEALVDDSAAVQTRKSLSEGCCVVREDRAGAEEENGNSSKPSSARISIKQERASIVFSDTVRRFIFTSVAPHERLRLSNIISRLGGIADSGELSEECTHLICGKLIRGAKLMGCIASGRTWVVGADYVDQSLAAGKWLPEQDFELGEPSRLALASLPEREQKLAQAVDKASGLSPMLKAGGAEVAFRHGNEGAPLVFRPTHAVVCASEMWNIEELEMLVSVGAKVFILSTYRGSYSKNTWMKRRVIIWTIKNIYKPAEGDRSISIN
ncbi:BRCA1 protein, partial [Ostertagia ostertagi]